MARSWHADFRAPSMQTRTIFYGRNACATAICRTSTAVACCRCLMRVARRCSFFFVDPRSNYLCDTTAIAHTSSDIITAIWYKLPAPLASQRLLIGCISRKNWHTQTAAVCLHIDCSVTTSDLGISKKSRNPRVPSCCGMPSCGGSPYNRKSVQYHTENFC